MNSFVDRFTPLPAAAGGCQTEPLGGTTRLTTLFAVPSNANSAWLQADADIQFRMDADVAGSAALTLPALTFLPLANRSMLDSLILLGSANVSIQFGEGTVGPIPPAPIIAEGGGPAPPGPGTVTSINVNGGTTGLGTTGGPVTTAGVITLTGRARVDTTNALHVMKDGNDATGLRGRLDRPYLTIAAAVADAVEGDTVVVWPGTYTEDLITITRSIGIELVGAVIRPLASWIMEITSSANVRLFGSGSFRVLGGQMALVVHTGSTVTSDGIDYIGIDSVITVSNAASLILHGNVYGGTLFGPAIMVSGTLDLTGNVNGIVGPHVSLLINDPEARVTFSGEMSGSVNCLEAAYLSLNGRFVGEVDVVRVFKTAVLRLIGEVSSTTTAAPLTPRVSIEQCGDVQVRATIATYGSGLSILSSSALVVGNIASEGGAALVCDAPDQVVNVYGDLSSSGFTSDHNAILVQAGTCSVYGTCRAYNAAAAKTNGGVLNLFGDVIGTNRWGAATIDGGVIHVWGNAYCLARAAVYASNGELHLHGTATNDFAAEGAALVAPSGSLVLYGGAWLQSNVNMYSVTPEGGAALSIRNYGGAANKVQHVNVTVVGTPILVVP